MYRRELLQFIGSNALLGAINPELAWNYQNIDYWGELSRDYRLCATGKQQTPINLGFVSAKEPYQPTFNYHPVPLKIRHNGRTILIQTEKGGTMSFHGESWDLLQFHFHHPSEHQIEGQSFPLEIHLVHRNAQGNLAVVGILAKIGASNPHLQTIWDYLPLKPCPETSIPDTAVNIGLLLPKNSDFYEYRGSLSTPPCSENVLWLVWQNAIEISPQQLQKFAKIFPRNARNIQPLNGRSILHS
jgi:carbonic anhydrase